MKLKFLTNREYVEKHCPSAISPLVKGGVMGCPCHYGLYFHLCGVECQIDDKQCSYCWDSLAKRNNKLICVKE